jgi:hypothetical protein
MAENLNYFDLPKKGAAEGARRYIADQNLPSGELGLLFAYGATEDELHGAVEEVQSRSDLTNEFPTEYMFFDGFSMSQRYVIVSVLTEHLTPGTIVGVQVYPAYEDPSVQEAKLTEIHAYMQRADATDKESMVQTITMLGLEHLIS